MKKEIKDLLWHNALKYQEIIESLGVRKDELTKFNVEFNKLIDEHYLMKTKTSKYALSENLGIYTGEIKITDKGYGFVDFEDRPSFYVAAKNTMTALNGDIVLLEDLNKDNEAKVVKIIKRNTKYLVITTYNKRKPFKYLSDTVISQEIVVSNLSEHKLKHKQKALTKIVEYTEKKIVVKIVELLNSSNEIENDITSMIAQHNLNIEFPMNVVQESRRIKEKIELDEIKRREDFRDKLTVTIDGDDAKDFDDAISVTKENDSYVLAVHIADVAHYVKEGGNIDLEAVERGNSTYLVDRVIPMLPEKLSNDLCSLREGVDRLTMSCVMKINDKGDIVDYRVVETVINSNRRLTYNYVNKLIANEVDDKNDLKEMITLANELSTILTNRRNKAGSINFDIAETQVIYKKNKIQGVKFRERGISEVLIENFMVLTNECVASYLNWLEYPAIYRVHTKPTDKKITDFVEFLQVMSIRSKLNIHSNYPNTFQKVLSEVTDPMKQTIVASRMLRSMQKAYYDTKCLGHFGLALKEYTHFTSPIRRYSDLTVHRTLKKFVFKREEVDRQKYEDRLGEVADHISLTERKSIELEREVIDYCCTYYMSDFIGYEYNGKVISALNFGLFVELDNGIEGLVHIDNLPTDNYQLGPAQTALVGSKQQYLVGQSVRVKVTNTNLKKRQIDLVLI